jgi:hypothetical protein
MPNIQLKRKTLLYNRIHSAGSRGKSVSTELLRIWDLTSKPANPLNVPQIPSTLPHLRPYAMDMAYVTRLGTDETRKRFKRSIYTMLLHTAKRVLGRSEPRIVRKHPEIYWKRIWTNLHTPGVTHTLKTTCYTTVHELIPTNVRLAAIQLTDTISCNRCGQPDSLQHRITDCGEGPIIWNWTRAKLGLILRMDPQHIQRTWPLRPDFQYWPPQRQTALLWILAHLVNYRIQNHRRLSLRDFMDFLKRARRTAHLRKGEIPNTGRYLELL